MRLKELNDNKLKSIKKNTFFSLITIVLRVLANFFLFWTIARFYGAEIFGQFTYAFTVVNIFMFLADFGLDILLITELAKNKDSFNRVFQDFFPVKIIFIALTFVILIVYSLLVNLSSTSFWLLIILNFYLVFTSLQNYFIAFFKGIELLYQETKVTFFYNILLLLVVIVLCYNRASIYCFAFALVIIRLVSLLLVYKCLLDFNVRIKIKFNELQISKYKSQISIFGIHYIFNYLYYNIDTLLLAYILGEKAVGIFQAVFKLLVILLIIPEIINNALLPSLSRLYTENRTTWLKISSLMNKLLLITIFPVVIIIFLNADSIIHLVYSNQYNEAIPVLKVYVFSIAIRFIIEPLGMVLTTSNRQKIRAFTVFWVTIISIILNIILIKQYNIIGAALTANITNFIVLVIYVISNLGICLQWYLNKNVLYFVFSIIVFAFINAYIGNFILNIILYILYLITFGYFVLLNEEERKFAFHNVLTNKNFSIMK
ncbi:MAG: oligosaccharide flippase family protein [Melioribacter sp.]|nr:oligosaccharide flippase family protein [Melioribacter sp.]